MTRQDLAAAVQLIMPNTDISTGNYPVEAIVIDLEPNVSYGLVFFIPMKEVGDREGDEAVAFVRARFNQHMDDLTKEVRYVRKVAHMPDMPPIVRERAVALLASDRESIARLSADLKCVQDRAITLAAALGETL